MIERVEHPYPFKPCFINKNTLFIKLDFFLGMGFSLYDPTAAFDSHHGKTYETYDG